MTVPLGPNLATQPFERVRCRYSVNAEQAVTRVEWDLSRLFVDPRPHTFTLQGGYGSTSTTTFSDIGLPAENVRYLEDPDKRIYAKTQDFHYRVRLETPTRIYHSPVVPATAGLGFRDWRLARDMIRKERLRHRLYTSLPGHLLKRRRYGPRCPACTEPMSGESTNSDCTVCYGTGITVGYFPAEASFLELPQDQAREHMDETKAVGTTKPVVFSACRMLGDPHPDSYDVFVDAGSDRRLIVHSITRAAVLRGYPLVAVVEARLATFSDIVYSVPIAGL